MAVGGEQVAEQVGFGKQSNNLLAPIGQQPGQFHNTTYDDRKQLTGFILMNNAVSGLQVTMHHNV